MNNFNITAYIASEPEEKIFENATVTRFVISVARPQQTATGDVNYTSALQPVEVWRNNIHMSWVRPMLKKGKRLDFSGRLEPDVWTDPNGNTRSRVILNAVKISRPKQLKEAV